MTERKRIPARALWMHARCAYIRELVAEGESYESIARTLSCDPGQAQLLSMTDPDSILEPWAELRQAQAGGWVSPLERMPKVGDSVVAIGLEDEPLAGKVAPHWRTADDLLLNTATGEGYSFEHVALWMPLPTPPEAP